MDELFKNRLSEESNRIGLILSLDQLDKMSVFFDLLMEANRSFNLTKIEDPVDAVHRHFLDSLAAPVLATLSKGMRTIDVGTGAGFPGIPLAILRGDISFILLDSLRKRTDFLQSVVQRLDLKNVSVKTSRAEDGAHTALREHFDIAFSRAVAPLNVLLEYTLPYVRLHGSVLAWKGPSVQEEIASAKHAVTILGGGAVTASSYSPDGERNFAIVQIKKFRPSPLLYPRKAGNPTKFPLI